MVVAEFSDLAMPFGMLPDGTMIGADEPMLPNGLACNCFCPRCRARLVARNRGEVNRPHFAHEAAVAAPNPGMATLSCAGARETSIHIMAKQIIAKEGTILLPDVVAVLPPLKSKILFNSRSDLWNRIKDVRLEVWCEGLRPDILASYAGRVQDQTGTPFAPKGHDVCIEILVTHPCGPEKIEKLLDKGLPAFEIDLSKQSYSATESSLRNVVIRDAPRVWLFHPIIDKVLVEMRRTGAEQQAARAQEAMLHADKQAMKAITPAAPVDRATHLSGLSRLDSVAMRSYNMVDPEEYEVVAEALRKPMPKVTPDRRRHQPPPLKE